MGKYYDIVPKEYNENLRFRAALLKMAAFDRGLQIELKKACEEDILFYFNAFCWTYDPRHKLDGEVSSVIPFITYDFQDECILNLVDCINRGVDVGVVKSRDMGASWILLTVFEHFWHFKSMLSFLLISRKENYVDEKGNPKSLFWKIDFLHQHQPKWLLPRGRWLGWNDPMRRLMHIENAENGSVIDGESTTGNTAVGDRRTAIGIDEFSSVDLNQGFQILSATRDVTRCRIFNSTPKGAGNAYFKVIHEMAVKIIRMWWPRNPEKNKGLYTSENGKLQLMDNWKGTVITREKGDMEGREVRFPEQYPFILDGKTRSPWYDNEYNRCASPQEVAQELDMDFAGSDSQFFDTDAITRYKGQHCRRCEMVGDLEYDTETCNPKRFVENPKGNLKLWIVLDADGRIPPNRRFVLGADISAGTGASNSTGCVYERGTNDKVAEYANPNIEPSEYARFSVALGKFFNTARIVPDRSGPTGEVYVKRLVKEGYGNIYFRRNEKRIGRDVTVEPGVWLNPVQRTSALEEYRDALGNHKIINRSDRAMDECLSFIRKMDGTIEHSGSAYSTDPGGARTAHGDIVIADALAWIELGDMMSLKEPEEPEIPEDCLAARMKRLRESKAVKTDSLGDGWQ